MSSEKWERQLEALFSDSAPEPDPDQAAMAAPQRPPEYRAPGEALPGAPNLEHVALPAEDEAGHLRLLDVLLPLAVIGEAATVVILMVILYRSSPSPLRSSQSLFAAATFVGMTLVLLFVQWLLARRLAQVERLMRKRNRQLGQAVAAIQRYQQQLGLPQSGTHARHPR
jgi:hypothetical protein